MGTAEDLRQPIELFLQEIVLQIVNYITIEEQILLGLSSPILYLRFPPKVFLKTSVFPKRNHQAYLDYLNHLQTLWGSFTLSSTMFADFGAQKIAGRLRVLSGKRTKIEDDMKNFIRLHALVEWSLTMQQTATDFVRFSLWSDAPAKPCRTWHTKCRFGPYGSNKSSRVTRSTYDRVKGLIFSYGLFDETENFLMTPWMKCVSYIVYAFRIFEKSPKELEKSFKELKQALV